MPGPGGPAAQGAQHRRRTTRLPSDEAITTGGLRDRSTRSPRRSSSRRSPTQCNFQPMFDRRPPVRLRRQATGPRPSSRRPSRTASRQTGTPTSSRLRSPGLAVGRQHRRPHWKRCGGTGVAAYGPAPDQGNCNGTAADFSTRDGRSSARSIRSRRDQTCGRRKLSFDHYVATEIGFDGGNVKYRRERWWVRGDPGRGLHVQRAGRQPDSRRPTATPTRWPASEGFTGTDGGEVIGSWGTSQVDLSDAGCQGR